MGQFNPFFGTGSGGGGGSIVNTETVRYSIVSSLQDNKTVFQLQQTIDDNTEYVGDIISFDAGDIAFDSSRAATVEEALTYLLNISEGNYNFVTFDELSISTEGKTMEQILLEVSKKNLPVNTIITGQLYTAAAPGLGWHNAEGKIQITEGGGGQQIYWCSVSSIDIAPYQWESIYFENGNSISKTLGWTPSYNLDSSGSGSSSGRGINSVEFTSSTGGLTAGIEGATDTYTINYTDGTSSTFQVKNGTRGSDGITPQIRVSSTAIEVSVDNGATYSELVQLSSLKGDTGNGITNVEFTSSTGGLTAGIAGATDTYTITFSNGSTFNFFVYNGQDGTASEIIVDTAMDDTSTNAVQNKVIKKYVDDIVGDIQTILETLTTVTPGEG